jgi:flagellar assembly factor FliW
MVGKGEAKQTLEIEVPKLGLVSYTEQQRFTSEHGLVGLPDFHRYVMIEKDSVAPFQYLVCEEDASFFVLVIDPRLVRADYQLEMERSELNDLSLASGDETAIFVIASFNENPKDTTLNFKGPIVFNLTQGKFQQVIDEKGELKSPLFAGQ